MVSNDHIFHNSLVDQHTNDSWEMKIRMMISIKHELLQ